MPLAEHGRLQQARFDRLLRELAQGAHARGHRRVARHELEAALAAAADPGTLELRVGALPLTLVQPLPDALARLRQRLPQVHVYLSEDTVPNLWRQMEAGEFDAIVCRLPALSEQPRLPPGIAHRTVGQESLVLVCGRRHPIARRRRPAPAELRQHDWVLPPEGSYTRFAIEQFARLARGESRQSRTGGAAGVLLIPSLRLVGLAGQANRARSDSERRAPLA